MISLMKRRRPRSASRATLAWWDSRGSRWRKREPSGEGQGGGGWMAGVRQGGEAWRGGIRKSRRLSPKESGKEGDGSRSVEYVLPAKPRRWPLGEAVAR